MQLTQSIDETLCVTDKSVMQSFKHFDENIAARNTQTNEKLLEQTHHFRSMCVQTCDLSHVLILLQN